MLSVDFFYVNYFDEVGQKEAGHKHSDGFWRSRGCHGNREKNLIARLEIVRFLSMAVMFNDEMVETSWQRRACRWINLRRVKSARDLNGSAGNVI